MLAILGLEAQAPTPVLDRQWMARDSRLPQSWWADGGGEKRREDPERKKQEASLGGGRKGKTLFP